MKKQELIRYNDFLFKQLILSKKREIQLVYRGDSLENLCDKLNVNYENEQTDIHTILKRVFMIGEKAKRFYIDDTDFDINDVDEYVFEKITKYFKDTLKSKNRNTITFFNRNSELKDFFSTKENKRIFLEIIDRANTREKLAVRNYYLTLLHQLAAINYKNKSHFVSTSAEYKMAEKFSKSSGNKERIILHCWQPLKMEKSIVQKFDLPTYTLGPFHYQREFSLLGGILPHFIAGIEFTYLKDFYPNPNIFKQDISDETFFCGLNVDQSSFSETLLLTNYKRSLITDGTNIWENGSDR